jgi:hypothetical protein
MSTSLLPHATRDEELLLALYRRDADRALELLAHATRPSSPPHPALSWARSHRVEDCAELGTGYWAIAEAARHVAEGRFEHAICLIERYGDSYCNCLPDKPALMIFPNGETR